MAKLYRLATRPPRDRTRYLSASSLSTCLRAQVMSMLNYPQDALPDAGRSAIFANGHWLHLKWQGIFLELGIVELDDAGEPMLEVPVKMEDYRLKGTIDCLAVVNGQRWIVDFKGINPQSFTHVQKGYLAEAYSYQLEAYMAATKIPRAVLIYENKASSQYCETRMTSVSANLGVPPGWLPIGLRARLGGLNKYLDREQLPPPKANYPKDKECRACPFQIDCSILRWTDSHLDDDDEGIPL